MCGGRSSQGPAAMERLFLRLRWSSPALRSTMLLCLSGGIPDGNLGSIFSRVACASSGEGGARPLPISGEVGPLLRLSPSPLLSTSLLLFHDLSTSEGREGDLPLDFDREDPSPGPRDLAALGSAERPRDRDRLLSSSSLGSNSSRRRDRDRRRSGDSSDLGWTGPMERDRR